MENDRRLAPIRMRGFAGEEQSRGRSSTIRRLLNNSFASERRRVPGLMAKTPATTKLVFTNDGEGR